MRKGILFAAALGVALTLEAHVTPNVVLVRRGDFVKASLPGATKFFEKTFQAPVRPPAPAETGWAPSADDAKIYLGREEGGRLVGSVVFLWMPSQHGPVGVGVAFGPDGTILRATVTDIGTEPLVWVRPLLHDGVLPGLERLSPSVSPDPGRIAPEASGSMSRYYAKVIAEGVSWAQAIEKASKIS
jgi:hypothetical protein